MQKSLQVSSSPHIRARSTTRRIMLDMCIAMMPVAVAAVIFFGFSAFSLMLIAVGSAIVFEFAYQKITHAKTTIRDLSAVVTGLLVAFNLPANAPAWIAVFGSAIAIVLIKQIFGGLGQNFMNPAMAARAILFLSFASIMTNYPVPSPHIARVAAAVDTVAGVTPLSVSDYSVPLMDLFIGNIPGVLGETSKLAILLGACYLLLRGVISWKIPLSFIMTVFICYLVKDGTQAAIYQVLSGGLFLGAFFMATDYATSPITSLGKIIMGIGCGIVLFVIRAYAAYPEGCSFAILFMNVATPLIDKWTLPHPFGEVKANG